ncbi:MAG TPA: UDP-glucose 4-epimerase GalE [Burkholderiales bacterium]|nr:UDP-glucose 4-epimerase GalE [Burkholderiales bacterium]
MILVTGGLGYIGSHTCVVLAEAGYELAIVDNLSNSKASVLERIRGLAPARRIDFHRADVRDRAALEPLLKDVKAVIHFAGLKAVGESVEKPLLYYENNVGGTIALLQAMDAQGVRNLIFSSSATVYGEPERLPLTEDHALRPANPYGKSKLMIEHILADKSGSDPDFRYAALRYFNPIGAHASGRIGEDPRGVPNNLFPYIAQVAVGKHPRLRVWGDDYDTTDGTGVRDYIHVMDLARGHLAALDYLEKKRRSITVNLGTGRGYSVLEAVSAFRAASGKSIPVEIHPRRPGDIASCYADASLAQKQLKWRAQLGLDEMCRDAWRWQSQNPDGYV